MKIPYIDIPPADESEAQVITEDDKSFSDLRKSHRKEDLKQRHKIKKWGLYLAAAWLLVVVLLYTFNLLVYQYWSDPTMDRIERVSIAVLTGTLAALVGSYIFADRASERD
ncbi:MAG: hypothetical protein IJ228_10985 [Succinivibrio sp.]|nr:hypothetical protein [Succinivibrio sp.]